MFSKSVFRDYESVKGIFVITNKEVSEKILLLVVKRSIKLKKNI